MGRSGEDVMAIPRIANRDMGEYVRHMIEFKNNNNSVYATTVTSSQGLGPIYVVYSYGTHFPMYAWEKGKWYGNKDKYSRTTSCHQSLCNPSSGSIFWMSTERMIDIISRGYNGMVAARLGA